MPFPPEYERAGKVFMAFLLDVRNEAAFGSSHQAYTVAQGVFQVFRRRVTLEEAIRFSNVLPAGIRTLFVADWDPTEPRRAFEAREVMNEEVGRLRAEHNFARLTEDPIHDVAVALRRHVSASRLDAALAPMAPGAADFWRI